MDTLVNAEPDLNEFLSKSQVVKNVEKLPGDASTRQYYRVFTADRTLILMKQEPFEDQKEDLLFLQVRKILEDSGVDVPRVYDIDPARGFILLEDLGDETLLRSLQCVSDRKREAEIYRKVVDVLLDIQLKVRVPKQSSIPAFNLTFDFEKLFWEVGFTVEHFYKTHLGRTILEKDQQIIDRCFGKICRELSEEPVVFVHRDFHSRNIMVAQDPKERMVVIDFQDARLGPRQYDLVSVLRDSYYQLDEAQVSGLIEYYLDQHDERTGTPIDRVHFRKIFDYMAIQRNFKAIGSFASFLNRRGNATYLKYIGNTFENIRRALLRYPEFSELREVLFHYYYF